MKAKSTTTTTTLRQQRDARIRADYARLFAAGQRSAWIMMDLSGRYFLSEITIEHIVFQRGHYRQAVGPSAPGASAGATA